MRNTLCIAVFALLASSSAHAGPIDFEGLSDGTLLSTQYPGVAFSNAQILTSGISLDEFEFPPHSGSNVFTDLMGPVFLTFAAPIDFFSGYFTHSSQLSLYGFDINHVQVAVRTSSFFNNLNLSGDPGSAPNELLAVSASPISFIEILGDPRGSSFVGDDIQFTASTTSPVPEPSTAMLVALALLTLVIGKRLSKKFSGISRSGAL